MSHDIGDRRKLTCKIRDESGELTDPDVLTFRMREPGGQVTEYTFGSDPAVVREGTGVFHVYWDCAKNGWHRYRWEATGLLAAAEEAKFFVTRSYV